MYTTALQTHALTGQNKAQQNKKKDLLFSQASLYQVRYTRTNSSPLTSDQPMSHSFVLETPSLPSTGSRQMTNTNLITPPFCQHNDDGFQNLFFHLFQPVRSNKNSHLPLFPCSVHSQNYPPYHPARSCTHKTSTLHLHTPTHLLVAVSGCVGLPLV